MNEFMKILLSLSVSGTLLLLLILGLKHFYKNKFSRGWQYYIWVIAALRFLLPFTADVTVVGSLFEKFDAAAIMEEVPAGQDVAVSENADGNKGEPAEKVRDLTAAANRPSKLYACLFFAWLAPALVLLICRIMAYRGFIRRIKADSIETRDAGVRNLFSDCREKLNIKTEIGLFCNPLAAAPMLIGFFHPYILLPDSELDERELSYIFMHELIHFRQKDMFYKWMIQIVVCIHWFNPFVYLLEKEVNQSCELSCDEKVIRLLDEKARREYGDMLISFLKIDNHCKNSLASVRLSEGAKQIRERLGAIKEFRGMTKTIQALAAALTLCILFGAVFLGSYTSAGAADLSLAGTGFAGNPRRLMRSFVPAADSSLAGAGKLQMPEGQDTSAKLCENCGRMTQRTVKLWTYETGPEVRECVHGYPYGEDLVYREYATYQHQCSACSYKGEFWDICLGEIRECHGYRPDR